MRASSAYPTPNLPRPDAGGARPGHNKMRTSLRLFLACLVGIAVLTVTRASEPRNPVAVESGLSKYVAPLFPVMAKDQALFAGSAAVVVAWDDTGSPADIVVLHESHRFFGEALKEAVQEWRRLPGPGTGTTAIYEGLFTIKGVVKCSVTEMGNRMSQHGAGHPLKLLTIDELDVMPKVMVQPMPAYPTAMQARGGEATVVVHFFIDEKGRVRAPRVGSATSPEFASEVLNAMRQWQFETPRKNGRPVVTTASWSFQFHRNS